MTDNKKTKTEQITFEYLENKIKEWFLIADKGIIRLICATVVANHLSGDPVWIFIIAPPSALKSELIRALNKVTGIYPLSTLTTHTLVSGQKRNDKETSLLLNMTRGDIFTFKDFTTILEVYEASRNEILSQLREVYDGQFSKSFGNGVDIKWDGKIGFIAGVTEAVDMYQGMYNILGERFLQYRMTQPDRKLATRMGMSNSNSSAEFREELMNLFGGYLNESVEIPDEAPKISEEWRDEIIELSNFATMARSGVKRDPKTRDIIHVLAPEMPIRFAKQLTLLAQAFIVMGLKPEDKNIIRKIALSSLPKNRIKAFFYLKKNKEVIDNIEQTLGIDKSENVVEENNWEGSEIGKAMGISTSAAKRILEDLEALGFLSREKSGNSYAWGLKQEYVEFFNNYFKDESLYA